MTAPDEKKALKKEKRHALNQEIGKRIQKMRLKAEITQEQFAEMLDVSNQFISDLERGITGASLVTLVEISRILCVPTDYLLKGESPDNSSHQIQIENQVLDLCEEEYEILLHSINTTLKALRFRS